MQPWLNISSCAHVEENMGLE